MHKWDEATQLAIADFCGTEASDHALPEAKCTWTYTRGRASTGVPSAWVVVQDIPEDVLKQRDTGVKVMSTPRLWQVAEELPAKTLNCAAVSYTHLTLPTKG